MDVIKEFRNSLEGRKPSTIRVYLAAAKRAVRTVNLSQFGSYRELLVWIHQNPPVKGARVAPFVRFLQEGVTENRSASAKEAKHIRQSIVQLMGNTMRAQKNPTLASKRDLALIASLCLSPEEGNPRNWPLDCLQLDAGHVVLWDHKIVDPAFALALRFWHAWRQRLIRPDQRRLYRKASQWSQAKLLFPGPGGRRLSRAALNNALRRFLGAVGEGTALTPKKIRAAFLAGTEPRAREESDTAPAL
jgi:hypothetical protein